MNPQTSVPSTQNTGLVRSPGMSRAAIASSPMMALNGRVPWLASGQLAQGRPQDPRDLVRAGGERGQAVPDPGPPAARRSRTRVVACPVEAAEHADPARVEPDLLLGLLQGGRDPVGVPGLDRAPGQADLAGVHAQVARAAAPAPAPGRRTRRPGPGPAAPTPAPRPGRRG